MTRPLSPNATTMSPADAPFGPCPACGSRHFVIVPYPDDTNFRCQTCGRCWHVEMGLQVSRVDPYSCLGCPDRTTCVTRLPDGDPFRPQTVRGARRGSSHARYAPTS
jgi:hypothetical protein